jgi:ectoine hydroxylase-related dioxygenase (phytanoyl-CoA dioxygenase family)
MSSLSRYLFLCVLSWLVASTNAFHPLASQSPHRIPARTRSSLLRASSIAKDGQPRKRPSSSIAKDGKPPKRQSSSISKEDDKPPKRQSPTIAKGGNSPKRQSSSRKVDGSGANKPKKAKVQQQQQRLQKPDLAAQLDYARNGHAVIRNVLDPTVIQSLRGDLWKHGKKKELEAWRQKVEVAADSPKLAASCQSVKDCRKELSKLGVPDDYLPFLQYFNNWTSLPSVYNDAVLKLAETAAALMDVESVRLYQDSLFWKRPGDGPTPWHTDARMAPFDTSNIVTLWIPLQPIPKGGTGLVFCSKSHSDFSLPYWNPLEKADANPSSPWNALEERYHRNDMDDDDGHLVDYMPLQTGDVTAHAGWTLHCADGNMLATDGQVQDRLALAITYVDARAVVREDALTSSIGDNEDVWSYRDWVGEVPARTSYFVHKRVPIVWPRPRK